MGFGVVERAAAETAALHRLQIDLGNTPSSCAHTPQPGNLLHPASPWKTFPKGQLSETSIRHMLDFVSAGQMLADKLN